MPVRPATRRDIPVMAQVLAASFGPDRLYQVMFPGMDEYWSDYEAAIREYLWLSWYDYRKVLTVSYTTEDDGDNDHNDDDANALVGKGGGSETTTLLSRTAKKERITGVAEWERVGPGWESVYGIWAGTWDPRLLVRPVLAFFYTLRRRILGNRAAPDTVTVTSTSTSTATATSSLPPLRQWNFYQQVGPFVAQFFSAPHRQTHWALEILAVLPAEQGKGFGRELVVEGLERVRRDPAGELPASVVAADGKETFYQKMGFTELVGWVSRAELPDGRENPFKAYGIGGGAVLWTK